MVATRRRASARMADRATRRLSASARRITARTSPDSIASATAAAIAGISGRKLANLRPRSGPLVRAGQRQQAEGFAGEIARPVDPVGGDRVDGWRGSCHCWDSLTAR